METGAVLFGVALICLLLTGPWRAVWTGHPLGCDSPVLEAAQLRRRNIHALRHTFASLLLQQGTSPAYVQRQMGHGSIAVTVDGYGTLIPGANRGQVDRLDAPVARSLQAAAAEATATPA
jgi:hypothetical protein